MTELNLRIENEREIILPENIVSSSLTLAEIGAVAAFIALEAGEIDLTSPRFASVEMAEAVTSLKAKGLLSASIVDRKVKINLNLENIPAASLG